MTAKKDRLFHLRKEEKDLFLIRMQNPSAEDQIKEIEKEYQRAKRELDKALDYFTSEIIGNDFVEIKKKLGKIHKHKTYSEWAWVVSVFLLLFATSSIFFGSESLSDVMKIAAVVLFFLSVISFGAYASLNRKYNIYYDLYHKTWWATKSRTRPPPR